MPTPAFFDSQFWRRFQLQRASPHYSTCFLRDLMWLPFVLFFHTGPVIEPHEFVARFLASQNGKSDPLGIAGRLLAMSLVVWASSFGVDENGQLQDPLEDHIYQYQDHKVDIHDHFDSDASAKLRTERRTRTNEMVKEMLYLIDVHGILRKPSWDGVRVLLMILPLAQGERFPPFLFVLHCSIQWRLCVTDVQSNLERLVRISISELPTTRFFFSPVPGTLTLNCVLSCTGHVRIDDKPYIRFDKHRRRILR